jgi:hypothetical protein
MADIPKDIREYTENRARKYDAPFSFPESNKYNVNQIYAYTLIHIYIYIYIHNIYTYIYIYIRLTYIIYNHIIDMIIYEY